MRRLVYIFCTILALSFTYNQVFAESPSVTERARQAKQRAQKLREQEESRYMSILNSRDLSQYNQFIRDYPNSKRTPEIRKRAKDLTMWQDAKKQHTVSAYQYYLDNAPYQWHGVEARSAIQSLKQAAEKQAWDRVKATNTIAAYQQYIQSNPSSGYKQEAENAINRLQGAQAWAKIKDTSSAQDMQNFIATYPQATELTQATQRLHELKGYQYYKSGNLNSAYTEFSQLSRSSLTSSLYRTAYDDVMEYHQYSTLSEYSSEYDLKSFLSQYPSSRYSTSVSNMLALAKARNLSDYANNRDYDTALDYAKDSSTRSRVNAYINANKQKQKEREKALKSNQRKENGGTFNMGIDFMDVGYNLGSGNADAGYYNLGLMLRVGNYADRVQFAVGVKPGLYFFDESKTYLDYYGSSETTTKFHMPVVAQLKLNLFNTSESSRFFIYGQYQYNAVREAYIETEMSWAAGLGFGWKHIDLSFYYRQDIGEPEYSLFDKQQYVGMSLIWYWKL